MQTAKALCSLGLFFLLAGCVVTVQEPLVRHYPPPAPPRAPEPWVDVSITTRERQIIQGYVAACCHDDDPGEHRQHHKHAKKLPPGLAKKLARGGELPPGWRKKLVRGEILPGETYQECHPLPRQVVVQLPPPPPGTILVAVNGKVVRLWQATREVLDVFEIPY